MTEAIYPLTFRPVFKDYPWGGRNLATRLGRELPEGIVAESWEIAAHPNGASVVANGPLAGLTLPQVQERWGADLVGARNEYALAHGKFPLLVKLLDANQWLSVQVHPADEYALQHDGEFGKTEMWLVLHAEPGAKLAYGFEPGIDRARFAEMIAANETGAALHFVEVSAGDVIFVPAGAIHALGPGIIVAEIQQNSDTTYRIYDWGRPRPLHIDKALDVLDWSLVRPQPFAPIPLDADGHSRELIGACRYFRTERIRLEAPQTLAGWCDGSTFEIWGAMSGRAEVHWRGEPVRLDAISWVLVPAALGEFEVRAGAGTELLPRDDTARVGLSMYDLVVRGGMVVDGGDTFRADVAVDGETIAAVGRQLEGKRTLEAGGCYVVPGAVDPHVHLQMSLGGKVSSDSFAHGTVAALCGGTTTVIDFADPQPGQSMVDALAARRAEADGNVAADFGLHMTVPAWHAATDERLAEVAEVVRLGCMTFKMYQAYARMALDDVALLRAMTAVAGAGGRVVLHSETGPVVDALREQAVAAGHVAPIWRARTRPARLEATAVHRAAEVAALANCPLYIFHVGCAEVIEAIERARARGVTIWGESCPQYLFLTADEHLGGPDGALYVCAPPLRTAADQRALWAALAHGGLDVVSTDHCPWTRAEKGQARFTEIPGGVPSIEARLSLVYHGGVAAGRLSLARWVEVCCSTPARLMGLESKGRLLPGYDADIVVFDPQLQKTISPSSLHETAGWTPYDGVQLTGWPATVLLRGRVMVERGKFTGKRLGRFTPRRFAN